jgi:hypothetical protein
MARKDVSGKEEDRFLEDEATEAWDEEDLGLDWDEAEFRRIASQLRTERGSTPL